MAAKPNHAGRKMHPADIATQARIPNAIGYTVTLFLGRGQYAEIHTHTINEARRVGRNLVKAHFSNRRPMVYALFTDGRSVLVPNDYQATKEPVMQSNTYNRKSNARRAAHKELMKAGRGSIEGKNFTLVESGGLWRYRLAQLTTAANTPAVGPTQPKAKAEPKAKGKLKAERKPREKKPQLLGVRAQLDADAKAGKLPPPPDFSAATHARYRDKLAQLVKLADAGDAKGLNAFEINPVSTSPKALDRYRNLCATALQARASKG